MQRIERTIHGLFRARSMAVDKKFVAKCVVQIKRSLWDQFKLDLTRLPLPDEETTRHVLAMIAKENPQLRELLVSFDGKSVDASLAAFLNEAQSLILEDGKSLLTRLLVMKLTNTQVGDASVRLLAEAAAGGATEWSSCTFSVEHECRRREHEAPGSSGPSGSPHQT